MGYAVTTKVKRYAGADKAHRRLRMHPNFKFPPVPQELNAEAVVIYALETAARFISPPKLEGESDEFACEDLAAALKLHLQPELIERVRALAASPAPIDMVLHCPACGLQHIDAPGMNSEVDNHAWDNPPHRSHLCHGCGHIWRPADVPTNGVAAVKTKGKADSALAESSAVG